MVDFNVPGFDAYKRFFYMWHEGACIGDTAPDITPYVVAMPQDKFKELNK